MDTRILYARIASTLISGFQKTLNSPERTSAAPTSKSGLLPYLEALGFHIVGYGCTTCIGNRNFEGRINPLVKANYLASPTLVVAFAIAGAVDVDLKNEPLGYDPNGIAVYLKDIWPKREEINQVIRDTLDSKMFKEEYSEIFEGTKLWQELDVPEGELYEWNPESTYIQEPPFFKSFSLKLPEMGDIKDARVIALLGNSITTDHISPAGEIPVDSPAGQYLISRGVKKKDFNSFGSRRGNHEVMMRGTFGNIRLRNRLVPNKEGGWTVYFPTGEEMTIFDAAMLYKETGKPLIVIGGREYGSGSSRDWAAKGTYLLGVHTVTTHSVNRIQSTGMQTTSHPQHGENLPPDNKTE